MKKLGIIFGGASSEYEVSLNSAAAVIENIDKSNYDIVLIGISKDGEWYKYSGEVAKIKDGTWIYDPLKLPAFIAPDRGIHGLVYLDKGAYVKERLDIVFPVVHGRNLEDGSIQGLLELSGIPYVGSGVLSSSICMDKDIAHKLAEKAGFKVPRSLLLTEDNRDADIAKSLNFPVFVKPSNEGSSVGISKVYNNSSINKAIALAFSYDKRVVVEEAIDGFEVGCAILGNKNPKIGSVDEIEVESGFLDFNEKYLNRTANIYPKARIDDKLAQRIKESALRLYKELNCRGFARIDMFIDKKGEIYLNEVNTIPGLTTKSRYPSMLEAVGISFSDMLEELLRVDEKG